VTGEGQQRGVEVFVGRGGQMTRRNSVPKTLIRTVVPDELKDAVIAAIIESARTPGEAQIGDGKIFVTPVLDSIRVRTGERGEAAI
jgi:nitrogen regulatory protein P-II 1